jgi:hypothetical protein
MTIDSQFKVLKPSCSQYWMPSLQMKPFLFSASILPTNGSGSDDRLNAHPIVLIQRSKCWMLKEDAYTRWIKQAADRKLLNEKR